MAATTAILSILLGAIALGDELVLKDGRRIEWVTLRNTGLAYEVETPKGEKLTISKDEIADMKRSADGPLAGANFAVDPNKFSAKETSQRLCLIENWRQDKGEWSQEKPQAVNGFRGVGESMAKFTDQLPGDFRLEFVLNVLDGMRPRIFFDGCGFYLGTEGFDKILWVFGDGAKDVKGTKIPYKNGRAMLIRVDLTGEDFSIMVDGKLCASGKRIVPLKGVGLRISAGDDWSKGTCSFSKFVLTSKSA